MTRTGRGALAADLVVGRSDARGSGRGGGRGTVHWARITAQSLPVLLGAVVIGVLAGQILLLWQDDLLRVPVLLALVPAVNGIGGNVGSVLGSRVASGLHLGALFSNGAQGFRRDITSAVILAAATFTFLGLAAGLLGPWLGIPVGIPILQLAAATLLAGLALVAAMILLVIVVGLLAHRYGWDPDNTMVPVLTTAGDTLGIVFLLLAGEVIGL